MIIPLPVLFDLYSVLLDLHLNYQIVKCLTGRFSHILACNVYIDSRNDRMIDFSLETLYTMQDDQA